MSRVLLHSIVFPPDGVSTAYIMGDLALELRKRGHDVAVLSTTPHYNPEECAAERQPLQRRWGGWVYQSSFQGIPVWHVKLPLKGSRVWRRGFDYSRFHLISLLLSLKALGRQDVVIATSPPLTIGLVSWLLGVRWGGASVYKVAEVYPDLAIRQGLIRSRWIIGAAHRLERFVYRRNSMIVPIAQSFEKVISQRGVPGEKLRMIPDCVDTELYRPLPRENQFSKTHGLLGGFVALYGGNIGLVQDWGGVLMAAGALKDLPIRFVIVGDGSKRAWVDAEVKRRGLKNVLLLGYQPKEMMPEINASCDIGLIPMTRTGAQDGFPSKVYTIMACGKPVLATAEAASEMAWIIKAAGAGRVVPPEQPDAFAEALRIAFHEEEKLREEGLRGRRFVERGYSKEAIACKYDVLIKELVARGAPPRLDKQGDPKEKIMDPVVY